jgi:predicted DNA-binding transcriptional regulator AlpA
MTENIKLDVLYTPSEVSKIIGITTSTLANWRVTRSDGPPFIRVGGRAIRYPANDLLEWLEKQRRTSTAG